LQKPNSTNAGAQFGIIMKAQSTGRLASGWYSSPAAADPPE